jgi:hypothetical protein
LDFVDFQISFDKWYRRLAVPLGLGPKHALLRINNDTLQVRMGWAFKADIPLTSITEARRGGHRLGEGLGVHGARGEWLVNGSSNNIVELTIDPPVQAHAPLRQTKLRKLRISVSNPDSLIAACTKR